MLSALNSAGGKSESNASGFFKEKFSALTSKLNKDNRADRERPPASPSTAPIQANNEDKRRPASRWSSRSASMAVDDVIEEDEAGPALEREKSNLGEENLRPGLLPGPMKGLMKPKQ